jgi:predicted TIM-barrel fold metal-dependent hydrolase
MIIDMHIHPFCKEVHLGDDIEKIVDSLLGSNKQGRRRMQKLYEAMFNKISIDDYVSLMNKYGIDKAVIVSFNLTTAYGVCLVTNDDLADFVAKYPDRFIGFAGIDVPAPDAMEQLEYAINSLELKGVKLVPPLQKFDISDKKYDPLWRKMVDLNIPLWTHTAHQISVIGSVSKFGHPLLVDELATRHQDLTIIMGHMGTPWFWDAWSVTIRHPNVYVDISAYPELYSWFPFDAFTKFSAEDKVLFASDHPIKHWNDVLSAAKELPISEGFKRKILGENAVKLLGI